MGLIFFFPLFFFLYKRLKLFQTVSPESVPFPFLLLLELAAGAQLEGTLEPPSGLRMNRPAVQFNYHIPMEFRRIFHKVLSPFPGID